MNFCAYILGKGRNHDHLISKYSVIRDLSTPSRLLLLYVYGLVFFLSFLSVPVSRIASLVFRPLVGLACLGSATPSMTIDVLCSLWMSWSQRDASKVEAERNMRGFETGSWAEAPCCKRAVAARARCSSHDETARLFSSSFSLLYWHFVGKQAARGRLFLQGAEGVW